ncbi:MAG: PIN domain-containing protein [Acidimicrobiales bacterium]
MNAVDTSVVVPGASPRHDDHALAKAACGGAAVELPVHVAIEAYAVLTRLPPPHRVSPAVAQEWLTRRFGGSPVLALAADRHLHLLDSAAQGGIAGGAVYDALVAATCQVAGAVLLTLDRRAARTYQAMGAPYRFLR